MTPGIRRALVVVSIVCALGLLALLSGATAAAMGREGLPPGGHARVAALAQESSTSLATTLVVTSTADSGPGTLRQAMLDAASGDTITFDPAVFPPGSPTTVVLASAMPPISVGSLTIDGSTARIALLGSGLASGNGLHIVSDGNVVKGIGVIFFPEDGIVISDGANNTIGGSNATPDTGCSGECNLISGNQGNGVRIEGGGSTTNTVSGNFIGLAADGTTALGNGGYGVAVFSGAQDNTIGGDTPLERNLISGNGGSGVVIRDDGTDHNTVSGNYIGTDVNGTAAIPNPVCGVCISGGPQYNTIGGTTPGERNIISGNSDETWPVGVRISGVGTDHNLVTGNYVGTDPSGTIAVPNGGPPATAPGLGVSISDGASYNTIGGDTIQERNLISGNTGDAVGIDSRHNTVIGNYLGVDVTGLVALGNGGGVGISGAYNRVGGSTPGERNIISGNAGDGVSIRGGGTMSNTVVGNYIGTDADGTGGVPNASFGIIISEASYNVVGGSGEAERNIITYNLSDGVRLTNYGTFQNVIQGNWIGVDADGTRDVAVAHIAHSPAYAADQTVYVGTHAQGVFKTTDGGAHWSEMNTGLTELDIDAMAVSPAYATDQTLFVGTAFGVFKSADGGTSWIDVGPEEGGDHVKAVALSPDYGNDQTVLIGNWLHWSDSEEAWIGGVWKSADGGATWVNLAPAAGSVRKAGLPGEADRWRPQAGLALAGRKMVPALRADGQAARSSLQEDGRIPSYAVAFSPDYATDRTMFVGAHGSDGSLYKSTDGGETWFATGSGLDETSVRKIAVSSDYGDDATLYAMDTDQDGARPFRSTDGGANWTELTAGLPGDDSQPLGFALSPGFATDDIIFASLGFGTRSVRGFFQSSDRGDTWVEAFPGIQNQRSVGGIAVSPDYASDGEVLLSALWNGLLASYDEGDNWAYANGDLTDPGNGGAGISVMNWTNENFIGGEVPGEGNLISNNGAEGIVVQGPNNVTEISGNFIGTDAGGTRSLGNAGPGVVIRGGSSENTIGGYVAPLATDCTEPCNLISGNGDVGILVDNPGGEYNTIRGNLVGTDATGSYAIPNLEEGISLLGGSSSVDIRNNLVSGNGDSGIAVLEGSSFITITGNYVGTDISGTYGIGNGITGVIVVSSDHNTIGGINASPGGDCSGECNLVSGNVKGVEFFYTMSNTVTGNYIGTDATGTACIGSGYGGIGVWGSNHVIGGRTPAEGNRICGAEHHGISIYNGGNLVAHNEVYGHGEDGIRVSGVGAISNTLTLNSIYDNGGLGINLVDGGNTELPAPIILAYDLAAGTASGTACANCAVELFSDKHGEGRWFEVSTTAGAGGNWSIAKGSPFKGPELSATATDPAGSTSEFGQDWPPGPPAPPSFTSPTCGVTNRRGPIFIGRAQMASTVRVGAEGLDLGDTTTDDRNRWRLDPEENLSDGSHVITATASTIWGTSDAESLDLTVDSDLCFDPVRVRFTQLERTQHPRNVAGCVDPEDELEIDLWPDEPVSVRVPARVATATVYVEVNSVRHNLYDPDGDKMFTGSFTPPSEGNVVILVVADCHDSPTLDTMQIGSIIDPDGYVYDGPIAASTGVTQTIEGVTVTLYFSDTVRYKWLTWDAELYEQTNPQVTGPDGYFSFFTPPGGYKLVADGQSLGYELHESGVLTVVSEPIRHNVPLWPPPDHIYLPVVLRNH